MDVEVLLRKVHQVMLGSVPQGVYRTKDHRVLVCKKLDFGVTETDTDATVKPDGHRLSPLSDSATLLEDCRLEQQLKTVVKVNQDSFDAAPIPWTIEYLNT
jgi:hypothetical protein